MPGGPFDTSLISPPTWNTVDLRALLRAILRGSDEGQGVGSSLLDTFLWNAEIDDVSSTTVGFQTSGLSLIASPRRVAKDGRWAAIDADPTPVTISGGSGIKYIYGDIASDGSVTLAFSTTAPQSESTAFRAALGEVEWDGSAVTAVRSYSPLSTGSVFGAVNTRTFARSDSFEVVSTVSNTNFLSELWAANTFAVVPDPRAEGYLFECSGDYRNDTGGSADVTLTVNLGTTGTHNAFQRTETFAASAATRRWIVRGHVLFTSPTSARAEAEFAMSSPAAGGTTMGNINTEVHRVGMNAAVTVNDITSSIIRLNLQIQHSASSANLSWRRFMSRVTIIRGGS